MHTYMYYVIRNRYCMHHSSSTLILINIIKIIMDVKNIRSSYIPANRPGFSWIIPEIQAMSRCPDFFSKFKILSALYNIITQRRF